MEKKKQYFAEICNMVLEINGLDQRLKEKTGDLPTAFFDFSGHVARLDVRIHLKGYERDRNPDIRFYAYTDKEEELEAMCQALENICDLFGINVGASY